MAIKYHVVEKTEPGVKGGGTKKFYANVVNDGETNIEGLTQSIERTSTVNGADILAVLYGLIQTMIDELSDGKIVRLGDLGSFRMSLASEGVEKEADVTFSNIKGARIIFTPGTKLKKMIETADFKKA